jgi:hypothetical protein
MKKVLATVAALGLVLGVAANALALDKPGRASEVETTTAPVVPQPTAPGVALWSVAGQWVLAGAYLSNGYGLPGGAAVQEAPGIGDANDAFYIYSFKVLPVLQVNDKIAMKGEFRFADRDVFGLTDNTKFNPVSSSDTGGRIIDTYQLYMEWTSPWGKTRFGRTPAGAWGSKFNNNGAQGNRLMWWPNMLPENWGSLIFTQKITEQDAGGNADISDQDRDGYYVDLSYKAGFGKTIGALWVDRHAEGGAGDPYTKMQFRLGGNYTFDAISLEYELNYNFGEASSTVDEKSLGLYADLGYKMQDWKIGGLFIYASGDDNSADNDAEAFLSGANGAGRDFNPTQILFGDYMNILNGDNPLAGNQIRGDVAAAGVWAVEGYASYAMSPALSLSGYLAYAAANEEPTGYDSDYGLEAGIGFGYKLMDNLTYNAHFSYLWTGDFFKEATNVSTQDIYLLAHALSMKF